MSELALQLPLEGLSPAQRTLNAGSVAAVYADTLELAAELLFASRTVPENEPPLLLTANDESLRARLRDWFESRRSALSFPLTWEIRTGQRAWLARSCPLEELRHALPHLSKHPRTLLFLCAAGAVRRDDDRSLYCRLEAITQATDAANHVVLLLFYGDGHPEDADFLRALQALRQRIGGLATLTERYGRIVWEARQWYGENRYCGQFDAPLTRLPTVGFAAEIEPTRENADLSDNDLVVSASPKVTKRTAGFPRLQRVASNEELLSVGRRSSAATLVFSLATVQDFEPVARALYELRSTRGRFLKLAVVTEKQPVRASSLSFLLAAGANVTFEASAGTDYIYLTLRHLRGTRFAATLPSDFDGALSFVLAAQARGALDSTDFFQRVRQLVTEGSAFMTDIRRGSLVVLHPNDLLSPGECLAQFHPKRAGDIACALDDVVLVFLYDCHPSNVEIALDRGFDLSPAELFRSYRAVFDHGDVLQLLQTLEREPKEAPGTETSLSTVSTSKKTSIDIMARNPIRPVPLPISFFEGDRS